MCAGTHARPLLTQVATAASTRREEDDCFASKCRRIRDRRDHEGVAVAVARMMPACTCHMPPDGDLFDPTDMGRRPGGEEDSPDEEVAGAIELLRARGYDVSSLAPPA